MPRRHARLLLATLAAVGVAASAPARAQQQEQGSGASAASSPASLAGLPYPLSSNWLQPGANILDTHAASFETRLRPDTVSNLVTNWVFTASDYVEATPTVEGNSLYVPDHGGYLYRINTQTGAPIWSHKVSDYTGNPASYSRNSPAIGPDAVIVGDQMSGTVMAVDKATGALVWKTLVDPLPVARITSSPIVHGDRVYVGVSSQEESLAAKTPGYQLSFRGTIAALDLATGKVVWSLRTVPEGYTGGAVWSSSFAVDVARGSLYVDVGNNYSVPQDVTSCIQQAGADPAAQNACLPPNDYIDSVLSLDLATGQVKWARRLYGPDTWTVSCVSTQPVGVPCPNPHGPDYDFGSAPNLYTAILNGQARDIVGAGQKSGVYWALDPGTGTTIWAAQVGPGGSEGGIEWSTAADGQRIYVAINNEENTTYTLQPSGQSWNAGSWAALDAATGRILWQIPVVGQNPKQPSLGANGFSFISAATGVMYAGSTAGDMVALNGADGKILWDFQSGGSVVGGAAISRGRVYWGSGYSGSDPNATKVTSNNKLYGFGLGNALSQ